ncbi:IclR family transcriptional regulator [Terribacillus saccharophilus]|uniref:IclR family transcriptional regulator n=1 Tax=Terribacillus saccharophilus TaxID=361277 RepID=UPI003981D8C8
MKTFEILRAFVDKQTEWGVNELARYLDYPPSSLHRILKTLKEENILYMHPVKKKYTIGNEWIRISSIVSSKASIRTVANPLLQKLSVDLDQSVYLAIYHPQYKKLSFISRFQSSSALQYLLELGTLQPIHVAASGKAILSFLNTDEIIEVLHQEGVSVEEQAQIKHDTEEIKKQGYSFSLNERKNESVGIGAPIFDASNQVIGSIILAIPLNLYDESKKKELIGRVKDVANDISSALGFQQE